MSNSFKLAIIWGSGCIVSGYMCELMGFYGFILCFLLIVSLSSLDLFKDADKQGVILDTEKLNKLKVSKVSRWHPKKQKRQPIVI